GCTNKWQSDDVVPTSELIRRISEQFSLTAIDEAYRGEVARRYAYADGQGEVGFISDRKSTRLNSSHVKISYAVFCLKKKINHYQKSQCAGHQRPFLRRGILVKPTPSFAQDKQTIGLTLMCLHAHLPCRVRAYPRRAN